MKYLISSIISIIITLFLGEILSIYSFGSVPTLLTFLYLISMFSIINYLIIVGTYIVKEDNRINLIIYFFSISFILYNCS